MQLFEQYKTEHYNRLSHRILLATAAVFVIGTTLLNIAFSVIPYTMVRMVHDLMA